MKKKKIYLFCVAYTMEAIPLRADFLLRAVMDSQEAALKFSLLDASVKVESESNWELIEDHCGGYYRKRIGRNNSILMQGFWLGVFSAEMNTLITSFNPW